MTAHRRFRSPVLAFAIAGALVLPDRNAQAGKKTMQMHLFEQPTAGLHTGNKVGIRKKIADGIRDVPSALKGGLQRFVPKTGNNSGQTGATGGATANTQGGDILKGLTKIGKSPVEAFKNLKNSEKVQFLLHRIAKNEKLRNLKNNPELKREVAKVIHKWGVPATFVAVAAAMLYVAGDINAAFGLPDMGLGEWGRDVNNWGKNLGHQGVDIFHNGAGQVINYFEHGWENLNMTDTAKTVGNLTNQVETTVGQGVDKVQQIANEAAQTRNEVGEIMFEGK